MEETNATNTGTNKKVFRRSVVLWTICMTVLCFIFTVAMFGVRNTESRGASSLSDAQQLSFEPSLLVTYVPTQAPSDSPSDLPSDVPSETPSSVPSSEPSSSPSSTPTAKPTPTPSYTPSLRPSAPPTGVSFYPGKLTVQENNLLLSEGLMSRVIAQSGVTVRYHNGDYSSVPFHALPDFGATFEDPRNKGGWIYVSNSEIKDLDAYPERGGVGAITFDRDGNVIDYKMILTNTEANCGGGKTPWGTWISCEEYSDGLLWQVDPTGRRDPAPITLGNDGGYFESFAYDNRTLQFFVTEDAPDGALRRFTPAITADWNDPWSVLHGEGTTEYLLLYPGDVPDTGTYSWTTNQEVARANANAYYRDTEGIDVSGDQLFFVSKSLKTIFNLDLDTGLYTNHTTVQGMFDGHPDQLQRIVASDHDQLLFFTEEGGEHPGVHARNDLGEFFTILESPVFNDETTGLAFSPDGKHLYVAFQETGLLFDVKRMDGLPFHAKTLNVRYHLGSGPGA